jgi:hypothetical protein
MKVKVENKEIDSKKLSLLISFCHNLRIYAKLEAYPYMIFYTNEAIVEVRTSLKKKKIVTES